MRARVTITEKGLEFRDEVKTSKKSIINQLSPKPHEEKEKTTLLMESYLTPTVLDEYKSFSNDVLNKSRNVASVKSYFLPQIQRADLPKYLENKVSHYAKTLVKKKEMAIDKEKAINENYLVMVHKENYLQRLLARCNKESEKAKILKERLRSNFKIMKDKEMIEYRKPPPDLETLRNSTLPQSNSILKETRYNERFINRLSVYQRNKYQGYWNTAYIP